MAYELDEQDFSLTVETDGAARVVQLVGELDIATAPLVRVAFPDPIEETTVIVDVSDLSFIASAGHAELVVARSRSIAEGWTLRLRGVSDNLMRLLKITGPR